MSEAEAQSWLVTFVKSAVMKILNKSGILQPHLHGVVLSVQQVPAGSGKYFANVTINGSATPHSNIPVNPDIATNVAAGTQVIVLAINYDQTDLYVAFRKVV